MFSLFTSQKLLGTVCIRGPTKRNYGTTKICQTHFVTYISQVILSSSKHREVGGGVLSQT